MSEIPHLPVTLPLLTDFDGVRVRRWSNLANGDTGAPIVLTRFSDRTIHITGIFGAGSVVIEGSNDGLNYAPMRDVFNNAISASSACLITLTEVPVYVRPSVTGDGTTDITVTVAAVGRF